MKRFLLAMVLGLAVVSTVKANSTEDVQFAQYVELTKSNLDEGMSVVADKRYRVIILTMPLPINYVDVTPNVLKAMKAEGIKSMKSETADIRIIKSLKISVVYNFITIDKRIVSIPLSYQDF